MQSEEYSLLLPRRRLGDNVLFGGPDGRFLSPLKYSELKDERRCRSLILEPFVDQVGWAYKTRLSEEL